MVIIDISVPLSPALPAFPGDPPVTIEQVSRLDRGDPANLSRLTLSSHSGTHIDAPSHFIETGHGVGGIPLPVLVGEAMVAAVPGVPRIDRAVLERIPLHGVERLLLKTDNSRLWRRKDFSKEYAALTEDGAACLVERGVRLVGIDYLSIESFAGDGNVHRLLLKEGIVILEGIDLEPVEPGRYELVCLPLKLDQGDGAPVRAILRR